MMPGSVIVDHHLSLTTMEKSVVWIGHSMLGGGLVDGLYFPWDQDDLVAQKICEIEHVDSYRTDDFVLEGGSFHVDGQGTVLTTEMCLLSEGRNPQLSKEAIEQKLCDYLNVEKVLWLGDGIDPEETNGHVDDVACFIAPGEVACIYTEDQNSPFYEAAQDAYQRLLKMTDAKGRQLKNHKLCCPVKNVTIQGSFKLISWKEPCHEKTAIFVSTFDTKLFNYK